MKLNEQSTIAVFAISMAFLAWMAVKLPMPALPFLAHYFKTRAMVFKVSVSLNLISFSISQFIWGPLSERFGRRDILIVAYIVVIIGTLLAMFAINIEMYISGRMIEGFAVGSAAPIGRAIMADKLEKVTMARVYAWYAIAAILPPAIGPVIGGYLLVGLGWRYIFGFFLILAIAYLLALCAFMPQTKARDANYHLVKHTLDACKSIASTRTFWRYVVTYGIINGFMIAYYAAMPYWFVSHFHMGEDRYAWLAFFPIATYILGSMVTNRLIRHFNFDRLMQIGIILMLATVLAIWVMATFDHPTVTNITVLMSIFSVSSGIITPMCNASLMHTFKDKVTSLSAIMSGIRVAGAALLVLITTNIHLDSFWPLAIYTLCLAIIASLFYVLLQEKNPKEPLEPTHSQR